MDSRIGDKLKTMPGTLGPGPLRLGGFSLRRRGDVSKTASKKGGTLKWRTRGLFGAGSPKSGPCVALRNRLVTDIVRLSQRKVSLHIYTPRLLTVSSRCVDHDGTEQDGWEDTIQTDDKFEDKNGPEILCATAQEIITAYS